MYRVDLIDFIPSYYLSSVSFRIHVLCQQRKSAILFGKQSIRGFEMKWLGDDFPFGLLILVTPLTISRLLAGNVIRSAHKSVDCLVLLRMMMSQYVRRWRD